jgi:hypothetical protein
VNVKGLSSSFRTLYGILFVMFQMTNEMQTDVNQIS